MLKKLKLSAALIIVGELLSWTQNYFASDATSNFSEFTSGVLLGLSVGMKLIGIILIILLIVLGVKLMSTTNIWIFRNGLEINTKVFLLI